MQCIVRVVTATCVGMLLMTSMLARGQGSDPGVCTGPYINESISSKQLMEILQAHEKWLKSRGKGGQRANLCGNFHEPPKVVNSLPGSIAGMARWRRSSPAREQLPQSEPIRVKMKGFRPLRRPWVAIRESSPSIFPPESPGAIAILPATAIP